MSNITTAFIGGSIFSSAFGAPTRAAVALRDGRIAAIGTDDQIRELVDSATEIIDISGRLLSPSFQDSHAHPLLAGVNMLLCDVHGCESADDTIERVRAYADANPDATWINGGGWHMGDFPNGTPTRQMLDSVVPDRPVYLSNRDGHGAWVNTKALQLAGITSETPDPVDGRIERESDGYPAGTLHEGAMALVDHLVPASTPEKDYAGLMAAQAHMFSLGITAWQDAAVGAVFGNDDILPTYIRAARSGDLKARVVGSLWWDRNRSADQIPDLLDRRAEAVVGRFRGTTIKIMQDGVAENYTAAMTEPYLDGCGCATENSGLSFVDPIALREYVTSLDAAGFQVHFHSLGDRAVREALDAIERAVTENGPSSNRHHLAHLQVVHPDDIARFARLGATANAQPLWACHEVQMDELTIPFLGEPRSSWQYPFADLLRAGAHLAAGSDWPVSSANPLEGMHVAVNRIAPGATGDYTEPLYPHNRLTLAEAYSAYTAGTARIMHHDDVTGHLVEGAYADLVVLDRNPFDGDAQSIAETRVDQTYVEGELVFHKT